MNAKSVAITATGDITTVTGVLLNSVTFSAGAAAAVATITDGNGGDIICVLQTTTANYTPSFCPAIPIMCPHGIYATISGTTPKLEVSYI